MKHLNYSNLGNCFKRMNMKTKKYVAYIKDYLNGDTLCTFHYDELWRAMRLKDRVATHSNYPNPEDWCYVEIEEVEL